MTDHSRSNHICDQLIAFAIPGEEHGTRAAATIDLHDFLFLAGCKLNLVLQYTSRPEQAHDIYFLLLSKSCNHFSGCLAPIALLLSASPFRARRRELLRVAPTLRRRTTEPSSCVTSKSAAPSPA